MAANVDPLVSVVIPSRDRPERLERAVASVVAQRGVRWELIIVDDGSRVPVSEAVVPHAAGRVVRHQRSRGIAAARNAGAAASSGEWVAFLDDDDIWHEDKLRRQLEVAGRSSWVFGPALWVDRHGTQFHRHDGPVAGMVKAELRRGNCVPAGSSNVLVRRTALQQAGGFSSEFQHFADWDLWLRLAAGGTPAVLDEPFVAYVHHDTNIHHRAIGDMRREFALLRAHHGDDLDDLGLQMWILRLLLWRGHRLRALAAAAGGMLRHPVERRRWQATLATLKAPPHRRDPTGSPTAAAGLQIDWISPVREPTG